MKLIWSVALMIVLILGLAVLNFHDTTIKRDAVEAALKSQPKTFTITMTLPETAWDDFAEDGFLIMTLGSKSSNRIAPNHVEEMSDAQAVLTTHECKEAPTPVLKGLFC